MTGRPDTTVAVLGAGPAGLAAAWRAALAGHHVTVLERADRPGGMAASFDVAGVRVDHGSHRLHPATDPAILAELRRLLGGRLQWRPRHGRIHLGGRWVHFPLQPADLARRLPPAFAARAAADAALSPLRRPREDTFAEVVRAGLGPTMLEWFYGPYAEKLWGLPAAELDGEQARRRIAAATPQAMVRKVLRRGQGSTPPGFWYPEDGFGAIVDALTEAATGAGVDLQLGATVESVRQAVAGGPTTVALAGGATVTARHVWSTLPVAGLARIIEPAAPDDVRTALDRLPSRAMVLVYLVVPRRQWTEFDAHYLPSPDVLASRVSEPRNYRDRPADPPDRTVLCAEVPCQVGDDVWMAPADTLGTRIAADLVRLGLPDPAPVEVEVRRLPAAYPVYVRGWSAAFEAVDRWLDGLDGMVTLGRHGLFAHDNTHHALAMGWAAAEALDPDGSWDRRSWAAARFRFREHVVED